MVGLFLLRYVTTSIVSYFMIYGSSIQRGIGLIVNGWLAFVGGILSQVLLAWSYVVDLSLLKT